MGGGGETQYFPLSEDDGPKGYSGRSVSISWIHESAEVRSGDTVLSLNLVAEGNSGILCAVYARPKG